MGGQSLLLVDDSGGGPCPSSWGPGVMDNDVIIIRKVTVDMAHSVKPYACHISSLVVVSCVVSSLLLLLLASIVVAVADVVVTV